MLKRRIIPIELLDQGRLVKSVRFGAPRDVGNPIKSSQVYSDQDADELVILNIDRSNRSISSLVEVVKLVSRECFVPLSSGGGISCLKDAKDLFVAGTDKVVINSSAYTETNIIHEITQQYGRQAVIVAIDVRFQDGKFSLYSNCGKILEKTSLVQHIENVIRHGAGEIMIQSIDKDGSMSGYDLNLIEKVISLSSVPVIAVGGAGDFMHLKQVFDLGVDAAACGSLFNFGDNNPLRAKAFLKNYNIPLKKM